LWSRQCGKKKKKEGMGVGRETHEVRKSETLKINPVQRNQRTPKNRFSHGDADSISNLTAEGTISVTGSKAPENLIAISQWFSVVITFLY
jgi:hypothetical protein